MFVEINIYGRKTKFHKRDEATVRKEYASHCGTYDDLMFILEESDVFPVEDTEDIDIE
jgi:hypothetical protein